MLEERVLREAEDVAIGLNRLLDDDDLQAWESRMDEVGSFLQYVAKRWTRRGDPHGERRCQLRRTLGRTCSCPLGCLCPQSGCGENLEAMHRAALPIYGESHGERRARVLRRSVRFGHWLVGNMQGLAYELDSVADPHGIDILEAREIAATHNEDEQDWSQLHLAESRFVGDVCGLPSIHACGVAPICPWPDTSGVYFIRRATEPEAVKIGVADNVRRRLKGHQSADPRPLELLAIERGGRAKETELHKRWEEHRIKEGGGREWFVLVADIAKHILSLRGTEESAAE